MITDLSMRRQQGCRLIGVFLVLFPLLASSICGAEGSEADFYLTKGDRVVFYGDSITEQGMYSTIVETYVAVRYPHLQVQFTNSGWGGDTVAGGFGGTIDTRLRRDVIAHNPSVITLMLGMNDGRYKTETVENDERYFQGYERLVETIRASLPMARITVLAPSPYDDVTQQCASPVPPHVMYNQTLISYGNWLARYAERQHLMFADLNTHFVKTLETAMEIDPKLARGIIPGSVHPTFAGHLLMAGDLLEAWHARGEVSSVAFDASTEKLRTISSEHAAVSDLSGSDGVAWTEIDDALPLPLAQWAAMPEDGPLVRLVLESSDLSSRLNTEFLRVKGLKRGVYVLRIDGQQVGSFNSAALATGVDLGGLKTPMSDQAMAVYNMTLEKDNLQYDVWRHVRVPLVNEGMKQAEPASKSIDLLVDELAERRQQLAQPVPRHFQLIPLS